jgi:hypothetical protein
MSGSIGELSSRQKAYLATIGAPWVRSGGFDPDGGYGKSTEAMVVVVIVLVDMIPPYTLIRASKAQSGKPVKATPNRQLARIRCDAELILLRFQPHGMLV